jgi:hypothetical protein
MWRESSGGRARGQGREDGRGSCSDETGPAPDIGLRFHDRRRDAASTLTWRAYYNNALGTQVREKMVGGAGIEPATPAL